QVLMDQARQTLADLDIRNISCLVGDGTLGWRAFAPYDGILVGAGSPDIPQPLLDQLADGGRLLIPVGPSEEQVLTMVVRRGRSMEQREIAPVRFVPLL